MHIHYMYSRQEMNDFSRNTLNIGKKISLNNVEYILIQIRTHKSKWLDSNNFIVTMYHRF
jgi:hypothetical protein